MSVPTDVMRSEKRKTSFLNMLPLILWNHTDRTNDHEYKKFCAIYDTYEHGADFRHEQEEGEEHIGRTEHDDTELLLVFQPVPRPTNKSLFLYHSCSKSATISFCALIIGSISLLLVIDHLFSIHSKSHLAHAAALSPNFIYRGYASS